jgi:hypothetical protein
MDTDDRGHSGGSGIGSQGLWDENRRRMSYVRSIGAGMAFIEKGSSAGLESMVPEKERSSQGSEPGAEYGC